MKLTYKQSGSPPVGWRGSIHGAGPVWAGGLTSGGSRTVPGLIWNGWSMAFDRASNRAWRVNYL